MTRVPRVREAWSSNSGAVKSGTTLQTFYKVVLSWRLAPANSLQLQIGSR